MPDGLGAGRAPDGSAVSPDGVLGVSSRFDLEAEILVGMGSEVASRHGRKAGEPAEGIGSIAEHLRDLTGIGESYPSRYGPTWIRMGCGTRGCRGWFGRFWNSRLLADRPALRAASGTSGFGERC